MTGPDEQASEPRATGDRTIDPASDSPPAQIASELVVHGLLEHLHRRDVTARDARIVRVFDAIGETRRRNFFIARAARWSLAAAAVITIGTVVLMLGVPGETTALATVQQAIAAMQSAGDRRYEVRIGEGGRDNSRGGAQRRDDKMDVNAVIDTRSPDLLLIRHRPPWSRDFVFAGRDPRGPWAQRPDGGVERERPERYWPPFVTDGGGDLLVDCMDTLLERLPRQFNLALSSPAALIEGGPLFERVTATRLKREGPAPHFVDLWIDQQTHFVERIEYRWDRTTAEHPLQGPGAGPSDDQPQPLGQPGDRRNPPPPHNGAEPDDRPPPPPDRDSDRDHQDRPRDRRPPPPHQDADERRARGANSPPRRGGLPTLLVFQRLDAENLPPDWFTPEAHISGQSAPAPASPPPASQIPGNPPSPPTPQPDSGP